jgi:hypothetical protein
MKRVAPHRLLHYEHKSQPVLPPRMFLQRVLMHVAVAMALIVLSLWIGVLGYHLMAGLSWLDAFVNASMILGGMGPVDPITNPAGKVFAALYALYSGVAFLAISAVLIAPFAHRVLHRLHLEESGSES